MSLNINKIIPLKGQLRCNLFENISVGLPLTLYYSIEIPLRKFNNGHDYVSQPVETSIVIDWIRFIGKVDNIQEKNWTELVGREFEL